MAFDLCVCSKISHCEIEKHHLKFTENVRNFASIHSVTAHLRPGAQAAA
jgi:hypothetical protein